MGSRQRSAVLARATRDDGLLLLEGIQKERAVGDVQGRRARQGPVCHQDPPRTCARNGDASSSAGDGNGMKPGLGVSGDGRICQRQLGGYDAHTFGSSVGRPGPCIASIVRPTALDSRLLLREKFDPGPALSAVGVEDAAARAPNGAYR